MSECLFCQIINKKVHSKIVYEDEKVIAFKDINPQAPCHLVVVPKKHISTVLELKEEEKDLIGHLYLVMNNLARENLLEEKGFRIIVNCKEYGGQAIYHLHFHLLGGRRMKWPPG